MSTEPGRGARRLPVLPFLALGGVIAALLVLFAVVRSGTPHTPERRWSFTTGNLSSSAELAQTMLVHANGLRAIRVYAVAAGDPQGEVQFSIARLPSARCARQPRAERTGTVSAGEMASGTNWWFSFEPIMDSRGCLFRLAIAATAADAGVQLRAMPADAYADGELFLNGHEMPADLRFDSDAERDTPAERLRHRLATSDARPRVAALAAAAIGFSGLLALLYAVAGPVER